MNASPTTLVLGWGNPGRRDDGLGPAFVAALTEGMPPGLAADANYQLTLEDAAEVARHERVVFVDADRAGPEPFHLRRIRASRGRVSFTTHSVAPEAVLALARELFHREPEAWLLGIRGHDFDAFGEELSPRGRANLMEAVRFFRAAAREGDLREALQRAALGEAASGGDPCPNAGR